jgi:hypothetical protein
MAYFDELSRHLLGDANEDQEKFQQVTSYPGRNLDLGSLDEEEMTTTQLTYLFTPWSRVPLEKLTSFRS